MPAWQVSSHVPAQSQNDLSETAWKLRCPLKLFTMLWNFPWTSCLSQSKWWCWWTCTSQCPGSPFCHAIVIIFFLPIHGFKMYSKDSTKPSVQQSTWIQSGNVVRHQVTWFKFPFSTSLLIRNIYINVGMIFTKFSNTSTFDYISVRYPANTCFLGKIILRFHYILFEKIFIIIWWLSFNILSSYVKEVKLKTIFLFVTFMEQSFTFI